MIYSEDLRNHSRFLPQAENKQDGKNNYSPRDTMLLLVFIIFGAGCMTGVRTAGTSTTAGGWRWHYSPRPGTVELLDARNDIRAVRI
jgi:hypothetical protein